MGQVFHYHIDPDILILWPDPYDSNSPARFITSPRAAMGARPFFLSDDDRLAWLDTLAQVCKCFNWICHAYCQMTHHYYLLIETPDANLSKGMRQLNGVYQ